MNGFKQFISLVEAGNVVLTPLYRGIAGPYKSGQGTQYFTNDMALAIDYANKVSAKSGLPPFVLSISVPQQTISAYRSKSTGQHSEVYDIPSRVVDGFSPKIMSMSQAQGMMQQHNAVMNTTSLTPAIFRGQGPSPEGWTVQYSQMGVPAVLKAAVVAVRDADPRAVKHPALQQRMQVKGEVPVMIVTKNGTLMTTAAQPAINVLKKQTGVPQSAGPGFSNVA